MLTLAIILLAPPAEPPAVAFGALTPADAAALNGAEVRVTFAVGRPAYTWSIGFTQRTICGPAETADGQERTAVLRGDRLAELREGAEVRAVGTVRVLRHATARVGNVVVPAWDEVRFEER